MKTMSLGALGKVIAKRRTSLNVSQGELADASDVHRSYISDIENGGRNITVSVLLRLARSLDTDVKTIVAAAERLHNSEQSGKD